MRHGRCKQAVLKTGDLRRRLVAVHLPNFNQLLSVDCSSARNNVVTKRRNSAEEIHPAQWKAFSCLFCVDVPEKHRRGIADHQSLPIRKKPALNKTLSRILLGLDGLYVARC